MLYAAACWKPRQIQFPNYLPRFLARSSKNRSSRSRLATNTEVGQVDQSQSPWHWHEKGQSPKVELIDRVDRYLPQIDRQRSTPSISGSNYNVGSPVLAHCSPVWLWMFTTLKLSLQVIILFYATCLLLPIIICIPDKDRIYLWGDYFSGKYHEIHIARSFKSMLRSCQQILNVTKSFGRLCFDLDPTGSGRA